MNRWLAPILWLLLAMPLFGSGKKCTDAEGLGFAGPIKSVSTTQQTFVQEPVQPAGPTVIYPLFCVDCEFDRQGDKVGGKTGSDLERRILDAQGRVQEEITENEKGEVIFRSVYTNGPAGKVQSETYLNGNLLGTAAFKYDSQGNMIESSTYKPDGTVESHNWSRFDEHGNVIESVSEGPGDLYYDVVETYNPRTGNLESFTSLNRDGSTRLWLTLNDDTVLSFWQQPGDERTYGSDICFADDNGTERDCREYKPDGSYATTHYSFTDKTKRNPVKVILRDAEHQLVIEADYDYELDAYGNWTKRTIWVQTRESSERQLLEKDARTLTYYAAESAFPQP
jgi:hypothetical protein